MDAATNPTYTGLEIAIIGIGCRFPDASNWREFWQNLVAGKESVRFYTDQELVEMGIDENLINNPKFVKARAVLQNKDTFDASFFEYRPADAQFMNPMHRVFHECVWEALEDANYDPAKDCGPISLYAGGADDLNWKVYSNLKNVSQDVDNYTLGHINNKDYIAALLSYKLDLQGPAFSVNTACSTSLVAVHLACRSLLLGEAKLALAGGVSLVTQRQGGYLHQEGMIHSTDGHCRAFDASASGTVGGEGAGVVVLKRLSEALKDGDHIYALLKGSALNNDGNRKVGFTAPSVQGQAECIRRAHKFAKVAPGSIGYVEAHGTGTALGDPIEVRALTEAFATGPGGPPCALGSVKTNIGHLDAAAGVAGLIKAALSLYHRQLPASLHFVRPNPAIAFAQGPFFVNDRLRAWAAPAGGGARRAGVSSFGIGGTNAHAVLEQAPVPVPAAVAQPVRLLVLSAKTPQALARAQARLGTFLAQALENPAQGGGAGPLDADDVCYSLQVGRRAFAYRAALTVADLVQVPARLAAAAAGPAPVPAGRPVLAFVFPGQGSQYVGMGRELYAHLPAFRRLLDPGLALLGQLTGRDWRPLLLGAEAGEAEASGAEGALGQTRYAQPLLLLLEHTLAQLLGEWGLQPDYLLGHSLGEYTAACLSGVLGLEDALRLLVRRGELMAQLPEGAMLSAALSAGQAAAYAQPETGIWLAAINAPEQVVFAGEPAALAHLRVRLTDQGVACRPLAGRQAFHSPLVAPVAAAYARELAQVRWGQARIPSLSNLTGEWHAPGQAGEPAYWLAQQQQPVQFAACLARLREREPHVVVIEVGPGPALGRLWRQAGGTEAAMMLLPGAGQELAGWWRALGQLWCLGAPVDWTRAQQGQGRRRVPLPTYCFEPSRFPAEVDALAAANALVPNVNHMGKASSLKDWVYYPSWKRALPEVRDVSTKQEPSTYLLLLPGPGVQEPGPDWVALARLLDGRVVTVFAGAQYHCHAPQVYSVGPGQWDRLLEELTAGSLLPTQVVYGWSYSVRPLAMEAGEAEGLQAHWGLVQLVQALLRHCARKLPALTVLTDRLHQVLGNESGAYQQALLLGLTWVLPQEQRMWCRNIDTDVATGGTSLARLATELGAASRDGTMLRLVALRYGQAWEPHYEQNRHSFVGAPSKLKTGGRYLITGGLGRLGMALAEQLLTKYGASLVLTGRTPLPLNEDSILAQRLAYLRGLGGHVIYCPSDVSDAEALRLVVEEAEHTAGSFNGVIHTAGEQSGSGFELAEATTAQQALRVFAPKVKGSENLYGLFKDRPVDFVWLASSLSSVLGGLGYGSYAAANLYMNHLVESRRVELAHWRCVALGELALSDLPGQGPPTGKGGGLTAGQVWALFEWSLSDGVPPLLLQTIEGLAGRIERAYGSKSLAREENQPGANGADTNYQARPDLSTPYRPAETETEQKLATLVGDFFGLERVGVEDNFFELGGDSLKAMVLLRKIKAEFDIQFTLKDFFKCQNLQQLAVETNKQIWIGKHIAARNNQADGESELFIKVENSEHFTI